MNAVIQDFHLRLKVRLLVEAHRLTDHNSWEPFRPRDGLWLKSTIPHKNILCNKQQLSNSSSRICLMKSTSNRQYNQCMYKLLPLTGKIY